MKLPHALGHLYAIVLPSAGTTAVCSLKSNSAVRLHETASCYRKSSRLYAYIRPYEYAFAQNLFNTTAQATSCSAVCMLRDAGLPRAGCRDGNNPTALSAACTTRVSASYGAYEWCKASLVCRVRVRDEGCGRLTSRSPWLFCSATDFR